jgi:hypothetical protein
MKTITMYEANDGKQFRSETECLEYEQWLEDLNAANEILHNGATLMATLIRANQTRPWWDEGLSVEDRVILMKTTKDTGFVISHWQCSDEPRYKPVLLNAEMKILLCGDADLNATFLSKDSYSDLVSLKDLLRYARQSK